jgi:NAD(P)-dependent dehydrogenase (short-subunit alcohol dehydrogenase family)
LTSIHQLVRQVSFTWHPQLNKRLITPFIGKHTSFYKLDLSSVDDIKTIADRIKEEHGHPTVLISNAGTGHLILDVTYPQLKRLFDINLFAAWIFTSSSF